jgi:Flp pilus assembly pilin Flp
MFQEMHNDESGQGAIQYVLLCCLIAIVVLAFFLLLLPAIGDVYEEIMTELDNVMIVVGAIA